MNHKQIVIGGTGRTGTTTLCRLISTHPEIYPIIEPHFIWYVGLFLENKFGVPKFPETTITKEKTPEEWLLESVRAVCFRDKRLRDNHLGLVKAIGDTMTEDEFMGYLSDMVDRISDMDDKNQILLEVGKHIDQMYLKMARGHGCTHWCEKDPPNLFVADWVLRTMPQSQFIWIVRNPLDLVASFKDLRYWGTTMGQIWTKVRRTKIAGLEVLDKYPPERLRVVKMEDLLHNQTDVLQELHDWIGIPFVPFDKPLDRSYHLSFKGDVDVAHGHIGRWKKELTEPQVAGLKKLGINDYMETLGYEVLK